MMNPIFEVASFSNSADYKEGSPLIKDITMEKGTNQNEASRRDKRKKRKGFRKAPQAPRRFKSPYILFSMSKMAEYKKTSGKMNVEITSASRKIGQEWKALSALERQKWNDIAQQDKLRYNAEKSLYTGPWEVPASKRPRKDPNAPKRPPSAFLIYCQTERKKLKASHPDMKNTDMSKKLGEIWKNAPPEIRQPHIDREHREREAYKIKSALWRQKRQKEEALARQEREAVAKEYIRSGYTNVSTPIQKINPVFCSWGESYAAPFLQPAHSSPGALYSISGTAPAALVASARAKVVSPPRDDVAERYGYAKLSLQSPNHVGSSSLFPAPVLSSAPVYNSTPATSTATTTRSSLSSPLNHATKRVSPARYEACMPEEPTSLTEMLRKDASAISDFEAGEAMWSFFSDMQFFDS